MKELEIKGNTVDKKFNHIQAILRRMARKLHKTVIGAIPPIPIISYVDEVPSDGVICRIVSPCSGEITNVCLHIDEFINKDSGRLANFSIHSSGMLGDRSWSFETKKNANNGKFRIPIEAGTKVTLQTDSPPTVRGVWIAVLIEVGLKGTHREAFLIEDFEKIIDGEVEEYNNAKE